MSYFRGPEPEVGQGYAFLNDTPATTDDFASHQRVAEAIATTVESSPDSRIIGLVGPWGSGKSTVVELLSAALDKRWANESKVHVFDAWTHHGEPVRRAFLEDFRAFSGKSMDTDDNVAQRIREVTGRATVTRTQEVPSWTLGGIAVLASLAMSAYGLAKGHGLRAVPGVAIILALFPDWLAPLLAFIVPVATLAVVGTLRLGRLRRRAWVVTPLLVAGAASVLGWLHALALESPHLGAGALAASMTGLCAVAALWPPRTARTKGNGSGDAHRETLLGLVMTRQHQDKRTKVSGMGVPTAVEFSELFHDMVGEIAGDAPLVVVIDNLDRLPSEDARELWSMLRTFFLSKPKPDGRRPVLLVPLAAASMEAMYKGDQTLQPSRSFMEKTFDVIFHVPAPIFTNWSGYFARRLDAVLRIQDGPRNARAVELLDAHLIEKKEVVTPRRINALVNLIATYEMQRSGRGISFEALVFYCINKPDIDDDIIGVISNKDAAVAALDPDWQGAIVALHHGVSIRDATQVVFGDAVERAMATRDPNELRRLVNIEGVAALVTRMVLGFTRQDFVIAASVFNVAHTLAGAASTPGRWEPAFTRLARLIPRTMPWRRVTDRDFDDLRILISHSRLSLETVQSISHAMSTMDSDGEFSPQTYGDFWRWVASNLTESLSALERIVVPGQASKFVDVATAVHDMPDLLSLLVPAQPDGIPDVLTGDLDEKSGLPTDEADLRLTAVLHTQTAADWHDHLVKAVARYSAFGGPMVMHSATVARLATALLAALLHAARDEKLAAYVKGQNAVLSLGKIYDLATTLGEWRGAGRAAAILVVVDELRNIDFLHEAIDAKSAELLGGAFADALGLAYAKGGPKIPPDLAQRIGNWVDGTVGAALAQGLDSLQRQ
jgi:energy-coupling factor transporter ATP-binding protein EcfA2